MSSFSISFLIEERETLLGDVSIEVVNEESSVDSTALKKLGEPFLREAVVYSMESSTLSPP